MLNRMTKVIGPCSLKGAVLVALLGVAGCASTGEVRNTGGANSSYAEQELSQARKFDAQILQEREQLTDPVMLNYLGTITKRIEAQRPPASFPIKLRILKDDVPNAFTTGGGYVYFHTGLLKILESEAELAMVMGHEFAHIDVGHIEQGQRAAAQANAASQVAGVLVGAVLGGGVGGQLGQIGAGLAIKTAYNSFSRDQERQADQVGFDYLKGAGYSGAEGSKAFLRLAEAGGQQSEIANFFLSTHPMSTERLDTLRKRARQEGAEKGDVGTAIYRQKVLNRL
ncbi:MAG: M48 family metalloprotease [Neomegalonema sp.]|nr:M48 family metalloprotease [Neomegalonema sp.]